MSEFTLLMSVYAGDRPEFLLAAIESATTNQTRPPDHVIVVRDGPVSSGLQRVLDDIAQRPNSEAIMLPHNMGLARALNAGLEHVTTPIVARADADDICAPERFAKQIPLIDTGLDVVGSAIAEFVDDPASPGLIRHVRERPAEILRGARTASPFHHPTVVFRAAAVAAVGGYPVLNRMEDYLLWAKMIMNGAAVGNIDEPLVYYRVGAGAYERRGGRTMLSSEHALQAEFRRMGFTTRTQEVKNFAMRGPLYRLIPSSVRKIAYRAWRRASD